MPTPWHGRAPPSAPLPRLDGWMWRVLGALLGLYAIELVARAAGVAVDRLAWHAPGVGFAPWQPLTRLLVLGPNAVQGVLLGLLVLGVFLLPSVGGALGPRRLAGALLAGAVGGTLAVGALDLAIAARLLTPHPALEGWLPLIGAVVLLLGLLNQGRSLTLLLIVVPIDVPAAVIVWGPLAMSSLILLSRLAGGGDLAWPLEAIGIWAGTYAWWQLQARARPAGTSRRGRGRTLRVVQGGRSSDRSAVHRSRGRHGARRGTVRPALPRPRRA